MLFSLNSCGISAAILQGIFRDFFFVIFPQKLSHASTWLRSQKKKDLYLYYKEVIHHSVKKIQSYDIFKMHVSFQKSSLATSKKTIVLSFNSQKCVLSNL